MGCCDGFIKCLLFVFNVIFAVAGLAMVVAGGVFMYQTSGFQDIITDIKSGLLVPQVVIIVLGAIIFVTSSLGCCGAIRGSRCKLTTYAVILIVILVIEIAIAVYAAIHVKDIKGLVETEMDRYFSSMFNYPEREKLFNDMEKYLQCCGVKSPGDYDRLGKPIPSSCCRDVRCRLTLGSQYWSDGCAKAVTDLSTTSGKVVIGMGLSLAILEAIGAALAMRLICLLDRVY